MAKKSKRKSVWNILAKPRSERPINELIFIETRLHSFLKFLSWTLVIISVLSYISVAIILCLIKWRSIYIKSTVLSFILPAFILIFAVLLLFVFIAAVAQRSRFEREIQRANPDDSNTPKLHSSENFRNVNFDYKAKNNNLLPRKTFWDAFPFASLVFFLVSIFMLIDIAQLDNSIIPEKVLLKLGSYLVAAIITSIVVLFGAHLVKFESAISLLTERATDATDRAREAIKSIGNTARILTDI
ncbi:MAG: hypothetical protein GF329_15835, partial [Candidatus Lokiarchaeota archaeon]|nr:hypothetical protein [Candidatus Lokiarchaeota archaeon]